MFDVLDYILKNINEGNFIGVVFLDFSKVFDMIDYFFFKIKFIVFGVRGWVLVWFDNYLFGRI